MCAQQRMAYNQALLTLVTVFRQLNSKNEIDVAFEYRFVNDPNGLSALRFFRIRADPQKSGNGDADRCINGKARIIQLPYSGICRIVPESGSRRLQFSFISSVILSLSKSISKRNFPCRPPTRMAGYLPDSIPVRSSRLESPVISAASLIVTMCLVMAASPPPSKKILLN